MKNISQIILLLAPVCLAQEVTVIVHPETSVEALSGKELKNIYLGKKSLWRDGSPIVPITLNAGSVHEIFLKIYVKKSKSHYTNYWKRLIFSGQSTPPRSGSSESEIIAFVARTSGAIGYVGAGARLDGVKALHIQ